MSINPNAPAFARTANSSASSQEGITIRAYLAGLAMQGVLAGRPELVNLDGSVAHYAVIQTDALIAALNKSTT